MKKHRKILASIISNKWEIALFAGASIIGLLWFKHGSSYEFVGRGDFLSPINLSEYITYRLNAYDINKYFGLEASTNMAQVFTFLGFFYVMELAGISGPLATGVFYYAILFFSMVSFSSFIRKFISYRFEDISNYMSARIIIAASSVIFAYSPVVIALLIPGHTVLLMAYASFPYMLGVIEDINHNKDSLTSYLILFTLFFIIAPSFANVGVFMVHNAGLVLYAAVSYQFLSKKIKGRDLLRILKKYMFIVLLLVASNLWWLIPSFMTLSNKMDRAVSYNTVNELAPRSPYYSIANMLLQKPYGIMHTDASLVYVHQNLLYNFAAGVILLLPLVSLFYLKKTKYSRVLVAFIALLIGGIYVSKGYNPPFEQIFRWFYDNLTIFSIFRRSVSKFYWFAYVFQITLFTLCVMFLWFEKRKLRKILALSVVVIMLFQLASYRRFYPAVYFFDSPQYIKDVSNYLSSKNYTYVYIPQDYDTQPSFNGRVGSYRGKDPIDFFWNFRLTRPDISKQSLVTFAQKDQSNRLYELIHTKASSSDEICSLAKKMGITNIVVRKNIENSTVDPAVTDLMLRDHDIYSSIEVFGKNDDVVVYDLKTDCKGEELIYSEKNDIEIRSYGRSFYLIRSLQPGEVDINLMVNHNRFWKILHIPFDLQKKEPSFIKLVLSVLKEDITKRGTQGIDAGYTKWDVKGGDGEYVIYYQPMIYFYLGLLLTTVFFIIMASFWVVIKIKHH